MWLGIVAVTIAGVAAAVGRRFLPERVVLLGWELFWVAVYVWVWGG